MLNQTDLKKINKEIGQVIEDNIDPQFETINQRFDRVEQRLDNIEKDTSVIKATMVTKSYLDDKLADLEGGLIAKLRKEDQKVDRLIEIMRVKSLLTHEDVKHLRELQVFRG